MRYNANGSLDTTFGSGGVATIQVPFGSTSRTTFTGLALYPNAGTVNDVLRELQRSQPAVEGWILDERGTVRRHINVFVNGERAREDAAVGPDDRIEILPAISGGEA